MKDKLLTKLTNSPKFKRLSNAEKSVELQDYSWQKKNFVNIVGLNK